MTEVAGWERHLQSALLGILTIVVVGFGSTTITASRDIAVIKTQMINLQVSLHDKMGDRYTGTDAKAYREFDALRATNMKTMIEYNQQRINKLEQRHGDE